MLLAVLINRKPFKVNVSAGAKLRLDGARLIDRRLEPEIRHAVLDDLELDSYNSGHFDGAAE